MPIHFIDLKALNEDEVPRMQKIVFEYSKKISRLFPDSDLIMKFKKYNTAGKRSKYSIHCRVDAPGLIASAKASDWELALTVHKVLNKVHNEIEHRYRRESQRKPFGKESRRKREKAEE